MGGSEKALSGGAYALKSGIHHIDTAQIYGTEKEAGEAIKKAGLQRNEVYITTKRTSVLGIDTAHPLMHSVQYAWYALSEARQTKHP